MGVGVNWVTAKGPAYGQAKVLIDGIDKGNVDLYAAAPQWNTVQSYTGLSEGTHTIEIRALGTKHAASAGTTVIIDAFQVMP